MTNTTANGGVDLNYGAATIVDAFPALDLFERRLSLDLYRLLAAGEPVSRDLGARRLQAPVEIVNRTLEAWAGRIFGFAEAGTSCATGYRETL